MFPDAPRLSSTTFYPHRCATKDRTLLVIRQSNHRSHNKMATLQIQKNEIDSGDTSQIQQLRTDLADEINASGSFTPSKMLIFGYAEDPRELYDISEVRKWCTSAMDEIPFLPYVLHLESTKWFVWCISEIESQGPFMSVSPTVLPKLMLQCDASLQTFLSDNGVQNDRPVLDQCRARFGAAMGPMFGH